jgi:menaquinone-9 beta-reductase
MAVRKDADVVVVGGGPAGSSTATHLARAGVDVLLLDKAKFPREKACAEYCSPGVVDALDDLGVLERIREREHRLLPGMQVVARGRPIPLPFADDRSDANLALGVRRSILDDVLLRHAADAGADVNEGVRVTSPIIQDDRVRGVHVKNGHGETRINADFVVAADGLHSTITRSLGLDRPVRWPRRLGLVARFSQLRAPVANGQMHIGDEIYCGLSPVSESIANVSLVIPMGYKPKGFPTGQFFDQMIRTLPGIDALLGDAERVSSVRGLGPMGKRVFRPEGPGYLLVGDASGFFDPLTGEGIHRALIGGRLAANAVMRALSRADRRPVGYRRARKRQFQDKQRVCQIIQMLLLSNHVLDYVTANVVRRDMAAQTLCGILGDYQPARNAFHPTFLWNLLRP